MIIRNFRNYKPEPSDSLHAYAPRFALAVVDVGIRRWYAPWIIDWEYNVQIAKPSSSIYWIFAATGESTPGPMVERLEIAYHATQAALAASNSARKA